MYYEINVSLEGRHFFATHERSITTMEKAKQVYIALRKSFTEQEGYELSVTECRITGSHLSENELMKFK